MNLAKRKSKTNLAFQSCIEPCLYYDLFGKYYNFFLGNSKDLITFLQGKTENKKLQEYLEKDDEHFWD